MAWRRIPSTSAFARSRLPSRDPIRRSGRALQPRTTASPEDLSRLSRAARERTRYKIALRKASEHYARTWQSRPTGRYNVCNHLREEVMFTTNLRRLHAVVLTCIAVLSTATIVTAQKSDQGNKD